MTKPAFSNVPTPYDWTISPPRQSREAFVEWMVKNRGEELHVDLTWWRAGLVERGLVLHVPPDPLAPFTFPAQPSSSLSPRPTSS